jgi:hypothetical protein
MPKKRENESIRCVHFVWRLVNRQDIWYADGRSNNPNVGRHSLGTADREEAIKQLAELDRKRAEHLGLVAKSEATTPLNRSLLLQDGRTFYETHTARLRVTGGVRKSTRQRYKSVFD